MGSNSQPLRVERTAEGVSMARRVIRIADLTTTRDVEGNVRQGRLPISPATWWRWVKEGKAPAPFKLGPNTTVWDLDQVETFLAKQAEVAS
jgi:predicted DNA-binding transcriptional regulator AlpA